MSKRLVALDKATVLVTGAAGFIGGNLVERLLVDGIVGTIVGVDNLNNYYDVALKLSHLKRIEEVAGASAGASWTFVKSDIAEKEVLENLFERYHPTVVVHLAAQAGVRYSVENPDAYIVNNILAFHRMLEACRRFPVEHLVFASSSSVYGGNTKVPFDVDDKTDTPISLYAATKKSNEVCAHAYSKLYDIPTTGLRFFTVYGPYGRPDMFLHSTVEKLLRGDVIQLYNYGNCYRDFTYIDDIVEGVVRVMGKAPAKQMGPDNLPIAPYALYNIGGGRPELMLDVVDILQEELVQEGLLPADFDFGAHRQLVGMQPGDMEVTYADACSLEQDFDFVPHVDIREGIGRFVEWYAKYCKLTESASQMRPR